LQIRCEEFKKWLSEEVVKRQVTHVLLISHLSFLTKAFDAQPYDNCEFRAFDFFFTMAHFPDVTRK